MLSSWCSDSFTDTDVDVFGNKAQSGTNCAKVEFTNA